MFRDSDFAEFLSSPRVRNEWDNLTNGVKHRQQDEEPTAVTAQVILVDSSGNASPYFEFCQ